MSSTGSRVSQPMREKEIGMGDAQVIGPKPTKACVNCRRQKMKCQVDDSPPCRRCKAIKAECIFRPRANAAVSRGPETHREPIRALPEPTIDFASPPKSTQSILSRLDTIEHILGITKGSTAVNYESEDGEDSELDTNDFSFHGVWKALAHLKKISRPSEDKKIWARPTVKLLWRLFHTNLPLLHFLAERKAFSSPTPLLLASILYISALHRNSPESAAQAPEYFAATCNAIAELVMPPPSLGLLLSPQEKNFGTIVPAAKEEERVFNNILGLIMASLSSEAFIETTGTWIAIGYRLLLDHCPHNVQETGHDWRGLFSGLQIIDIEHASIHMCYPLLPKQPPPLPLRNLDRQQDNAYRGLAQMMHSGLSHFVGRSLPSVWSFVSGQESNAPPGAESQFTEHDLQVIRHWAKQLDDWLVHYNGASQPSEADRHGILILLQYHLHKLFVLFIYHPARGFDLVTHNIASVERHELLISARAVLRLQHNDTGIWSNWDLVMVTLAALLVLRSVEDGLAHQDDLILVQSHLSSLHRSQRPAPSLQHILIDRLQTAMQGMPSPSSTVPDIMLPDGNLEYNWAIFDPNNIPLANPSWLQQYPMQATPAPKQAVPVHNNSTSRDGLNPQYPLGLVTDDSQFPANRQWVSPDQNGNAWPSTLYRLFGQQEPGPEDSSLG